MGLIKKHLVKIEIVTALLLVGALFIRFDGKAQYDNGVLDTQHRIPTAIVVGGPNESGKPGDKDEVKVQVLGTSTSAGSLLEGLFGSQDVEISDDTMDRYEAALEYDIPENIAFANVNESLSVRKSANGESEQIGIMYPGNYCIVESVDGEWAKITTGSVKGYCRVKYLIRGDEAVEYAKKHVKCTVKTTGNANIRSGATTQEDNIITTVTPGKEFSVTNAVVFSKDPTTPFFVEISYEGKTAYLAMSLAKLNYTWTAGKTYKAPVKVEVQSQTTTDKNNQANGGSNGTTKPQGNTSAIRSEIVAQAKKALGVKYVYGGNSLSSGVDCSGFIHAVFKAAGADVIYSMPRSSNPMSKSTLGKKITFAEAKPGDLMFYGSGGKTTVDHVAIYIGDGKIIHASSVDKKVLIEDWDYRIPLVIRNFIG